VKLRRKHDETETQESTPKAKAPSLTRDTVVDAVLAKEPTWRKGQVREAIAAYEREIARSLADGYVVKLPGFLQLEPVTRPERTGRNPRNGQAITIPAKRVVRVKILKRFADQVANADS